MRLIGLRTGTGTAIALAQLRTLARLEDGEREPGDGGGDELRDGGEDVEDAEVDAGHVAGVGGCVVVVVVGVGVEGGIGGVCIGRWVWEWEWELRGMVVVVGVGKLVHFEGGAVLREAGVGLRVGCGRRAEFVDLDAHDC